MVTGTIIVDFEDIFVDDCTAEMMYINEHRLEFLRFLINKSPLEFLSNERKHRDPVIPMLKDHKNITMIGLMNALSKFYCDIDSYSKYLKLTAFANKLLYDTPAIFGSRIKDVIILYTYMNDAQKRVKEEIINNMGLPERFKSIGMKPNEISDVFRRVDWNLYITSNKANILSLVENKDFNISKKEFLMPKGGYTNLEPKVEILIEEKGGTINYYER